jgi:hypothetical protein
VGQPEVQGYPVPFWADAVPAEAASKTAVKVATRALRTYQTFAFVIEPFSFVVPQRRITPASTEKCGDYRGVKMSWQ